MTSDEESYSGSVSSGNDTSFLSVDSGGPVYVPTQKCVIPSVQILFESCLSSGGRNKVRMSVQVAFIVAGYTHVTYYRALKQALGIDTIYTNTFMSTIVKMYPVVKQMLYETCELGKKEMKT